MSTEEVLSKFRILCWDAFIAVLGHVRPMGWMPRYTVALENQPERRAKFHCCLCWKNAPPCSGLLLRPLSTFRTQASVALTFGGVTPTVQAARPRCLGLLGRPSVPHRRAVGAAGLPKSSALAVRAGTRLPCH